MPHLRSSIKNSAGGSCNKVLWCIPSSHQECSSHQVLLWDVRSWEGEKREGYVSFHNQLKVFHVGLVAILVWYGRGSVSENLEKETPAFPLSLSWNWHGRRAFYICNMNSLSLGLPSGYWGCGKASSFFAPFPIPLHVLEVTKRMFLAGPFQFAIAMNQCNKMHSWGVPLRMMKPTYFLVTVPSMKLPEAVALVADEGGHTLTHWLQLLLPIWKSVKLSRRGRGGGDMIDGFN